MMHTPTLDDFAPLRGERFALTADPAPGSSPLSAELLEASALPQAPLNGRQAFSLIFTGPPAPVLPQRTYQLAHPQLPPLDVFLVPVAADAAGVRYQAIFS